MVSHDVSLLGYHDFIKLLCCIVSQLWENIEIMSKLVVTLTYNQDIKNLR